MTPSDTRDLRPTVLEVDLDAVVRNACTLAETAGTPLLAVVKANAYGVGALPVARALERAGAAFLGVALVEEGIQFRRAGLSCPILMLGPVQPDQVPALLHHDLVPSVYSVEFLRAVEAEASRRGRTVGVHLKVDSGMGRVGFREEELPGLLAALGRCRNVELEGVFSNLASGDDPASPQNASQTAAFLRMVEACRRAGFEPRWIHLANSAGLLAHPATRLTLCRPGLTLYGLRPSEAVPDPGLGLAVRLETAVLQIKTLPPGTPVGYGATYVTDGPRRVGILPVGYGDGLPRSLGNVGHVLVGGAPCAILGRVSMDLTAVDLEPAWPVAPGQRVLLWGEEGTRKITPWDWARWSGTIPYEILTGISCRVARRYVENGRSWTEVGILR